MTALETAEAIYPYRIDRKCAECEGRMRPVGMMLTIDPPLFPHRCNKCGRQENFQTNYPHIEYRDTAPNREVPEGYDAKCGGCRLPYTFRNARSCNVTEWKLFCSRTCAGEPIFNQRQGRWIYPNK